MSKDTQGNALWPEFLPEVERALNSALDAVAVQEQALAAFTPVENDAMASRLDRNRDRIYGLNACVERPQQVCADFDKSLDGDETNARDYLKQIDTLRQRLADWTEGNRVKSGE